MPFFLYTRDMIKKDLENRITELENILKLSSAMVYTFEAFGDYNATYISENVLSVTGYTTKEYLSKGFWASHIHPDDVPNVFKNLEKLFENNHHKHEYRFRFKDGLYYWMSDELKLVKCGKGKPKDIIGTWTNINKLKEGEIKLEIQTLELVKTKQKIKDSEERFELLLESSENMISIHNIDGTYLYYNGPSRCSLTKEDALGKTPYDFFKKEKADILANNIKSVGKTGISKTIEIELNWFGEMKWFSEYFYLMKGDTKKGVRIVKVCQDITERKKTENENIKLYKTIEESEKNFRELFEKSGDAIFIFTNGVLIDCNKAALDLFKFKTKKDVLKIHPSEKSPKFQPDGQSSREKSEEMLKIALKNETHQFEWMYKKSNGENFPGEITLTTIINEPGNITLHAVIRDITLRKKAEKEIIESQKRIEKSEKYLENIINNMGDAVFVKNSKRKVVLVNDAFCEIFKIAKEDIIGKLHTQATTPKELERFIKSDKQVLSNGKESVIEELLTIKDHKPITISTRKTRFIGNDGEKYLIGVTRNVSEARLVKKELIAAKETAERNEEELISTQELAGIGSWTLDLKSNEVVWSKELYRMYGFDPSLPVPPYTEHMKLVTPESWDLLSSSVENTTKTGVPYTIELRTLKKDGSKGWMWARGEVA